jgi:hypothetical protein
MKKCGNGYAKKSANGICHSAHSWASGTLINACPPAYIPSIVVMGFYSRISLATYDQCCQATAKFRLILLFAKHKLRYWYGIDNAGTKGIGGILDHGLKCIR